MVRFHNSLIFVSKLVALKTIILDLLFLSPLTLDYKFPKPFFNQSELLYMNKLYALRIVTLSSNYLLSIIIGHLKPYNSDYH